MVPHVFHGTKTVPEDRSPPFGSNWELRAVEPVLSVGHVPISYIYIACIAFSIIKNVCFAWLFCLKFHSKHPNDVRKSYVTCQQTVVRQLTLWRVAGKGIWIWVRATAVQRPIFPGLSRIGDPAHVFGEVQLYYSCRTGELSTPLAHRMAMLFAAPKVEGYFFCFDQTGEEEESEEETEEEDPEDTGFIKFCGSLGFYCMWNDAKTSEDQLDNTYSNMLPQRGQMCSCNRINPRR